MMMRAAGAGVLALVISGAAAADEPGGPFLGAGAGTLGLGVESGYAFGERFTLRVAAYGFTYDDEREESGINYDAELDLGNIGAVLDWHPFAGAFRLSAGWFSTDNGINATALPGPGGTYDIGGFTFTEAEVGTLTADADFGSSAPYLGLGWNFGGTDGGLGFSLDLGVLFQDSPDVILNSTGGSLSGDPLLQQALAEEARELEDDVDQYDLYPVLSFGVGYRF